MYTLQQFADWLKTMPPEKKYNFYDADNCALTQFARAQGDQRDYGDVPEFRHGILPSVAYFEPHTFGDALKRAEKELVAQCPNMLFAEGRPPAPQPPPPPIPHDDGDDCAD